MQRPFYGFYLTVLHKRTPFLMARIYLVASLVASVVTPALDIPIWWVAPIEAPDSNYTVGDEIGADNPELQRPSIGYFSTERSQTLEFV